MDEDLKAIEASLRGQVQAIDVEKIGEKGVLKAAPLAQLFTLTYLTFTLILATQQLVEIKETLLRMEDKGE